MPMTPLSWAFSPLSVFFSLSLTVFQLLSGSYLNLCVLFFPILPIPGEGWKGGEWASGSVVLSWHLGLNHSTGTEALSTFQNQHFTHCCCIVLLFFLLSPFCSPHKGDLLSSSAASSADLPLRSHTLLAPDFSPAVTPSSLYWNSLPWKVIQWQTAVQMLPFQPKSAQHRWGKKKLPWKIFRSLILDCLQIAACAVAHCLISGVGLIILKRANITPSDFRETSFKCSRVSIQLDVCDLSGFFGL